MTFPSSSRFDPPADPRAMVADRVPVLTWDEFLAQFNWTQGQHVTLVGPNGRGKTVLLTHILPMRGYKIFLGTKRKDATQTALVQGKGDHRYHLAKRWEEIHQDVSPNWMLKPPFPKNASVAQVKAVQAQVFNEALMKVFRQGGWTVVGDELRYLTDYLGLTDICQLLLLQGRSLEISFVTGTQRPRWVPLEAFSQASHLFFWQTPDHQDVARVAELASINRETIMEVVPRLNPDAHEVLYVNPKSGYMAVTVPPPPLS